MIMMAMSKERTNPIVSFQSKDPGDYHSVQGCPITQSPSGPWGQNFLAFPTQKPHLHIPSQTTLAFFLPSSHAKLFTKAFGTASSAMETLFSPAPTLHDWLHY